MIWWMIKKFFWVIARLSLTIFITFWGLVVGILYDPQVLKELFTEYGAMLRSVWLR